MTDLERELLGALERLESDYTARQAEWASAFEALQRMFDTTRQDNEKLARHVMRLSQQVERLSGDISNWEPATKRR